MDFRLAVIAEGTIFFLTRFRVCSSGQEILSIALADSCRRVASRQTQRGDSETSPRDTVVVSSRIVCVYVCTSRVYCVHNPWRRRRALKPDFERYKGSRERKIERERESRLPPTAILFVFIYRCTCFTREIIQRIKKKERKFRLSLISIHFFFARIYLYIYIYFIFYARSL